VGLASDCIRHIESDRDNIGDKSVTNSTTVMETAKISVGSVIEAKYRGGSKYFCGKITRVRFNGNFDIVYDDGRKEMNVHRDMIRSITKGSLPDGANDDQINADSLKNNSVSIKVGDKVEGKYRGRGSRWYAGFVSKIKKHSSRAPNDVLYDVQYDDGDADFDLAPDCIRKIDNELSNSNKQHLMMNDNGNDDGNDKQNSIDGDNNIKSPLFKVGDRVEAKFRGRGKMYKGRISKVHSRDNGECVFDVDYDDGDLDRELPPDVIKKIDIAGATVLPNDLEGEMSMIPQRGDDPHDNDCSHAVVKGRSSNEFHLGDRVEGKFRGRGTRWFKGIIAKIHANGTTKAYDVDYDDGDTDVGLASDCIRHIESDRDNIGDKSVTNSTTVMETAKISVGSVIEAKYRGGSKYFCGKITRVRFNGNFDIVYDDGRKEMNVHRDMIRSITKGSLPDGANDDQINADSLKNNSVSIKVGDKVEGKYRGRGSRWYAGFVSKIKKHSSRAPNDVLYDVQYDDGDADFDLAPDCIRKIDNQPHINNNEEAQLPTAIKEPKDTPLHSLKQQQQQQQQKKKLLDDRNSSLVERGTKIEGRYRGGSKFSPGIIIRVRQNGNFDVLYDNGEREMNVPRNMIRLVIDSCDDDNDDDTSLASRGKDDKEDGKGTIDDEDDDALSQSVNPIIGSEAPLLKVGDIVEARFRGRGKMYKGKISKVHSRKNGEHTFDVDYVDGDVDTGLPSNAIRKLSRDGNDNPPAPIDEGKLSTQKWQIGTKVETRHRGKNGRDDIDGGRHNFYPSTIVRVRSNGHCDVRHDDTGVKELNVSPDRIRAVVAATDAAPLVSPRAAVNSKGRNGKDSDNLALRGSDEVFVVLKVGDKVQGRFRGRGSRWYNGVISRIHKENEKEYYDVQYDDGDFDQRLPVTAIKKINEEHNDDEMAREKRQLPIATATEDTSVANRTTTSDTNNCNRVNGASNGSDNKVMSWSHYSVGDTVHVPTFGNGEGGSVEATIVEVKILYSVKYPNGAICRNMPSDDIKHNSSNSSSPSTSARNNVAQGIFGKHKENTTLIGKEISHTDETSAVKSIKSTVMPRDKNDNNRNNETTSQQHLKVGTKIEARYRGKKKYYPGVITRCCANNCFDILYNDGGRETSVAHDFIRPLLNTNNDDRSDGSGANWRQRARVASAVDKVADQFKAMAKGRDSAATGATAGEIVPSKTMTGSGTTRSLTSPVSGGNGGGSGGGLGRRLGSPSLSSRRLW